MKPALKYAGCKSFLLPRLTELYAPHRHRRLIEPFVGSMAVALGLQPKRALLADINSDLVAFHNRLRDPRPFLWMPKKISTNEEYLALRNTFNKSTDGLERGELFYALNKTCFNGLSRYNRSGVFNVPWGKRTVELRRDFSEYVPVVFEWKIVSGDFGKILSRIFEDDFVYVDPPYDDTFADYATGGFDWAAQERLAAQLATHPGPVVASNSATPRVLNLYHAHGFKVDVIGAPRRISANGNRNAVIEMLATKNLDQG